MYAMTLSIGEGFSTASSAQPISRAEAGPHDRQEQHKRDQDAYRAVLQQTRESALLDQVTSEETGDQKE